MKDVRVRPDGSLEMSLDRYRWLTEAGSADGECRAWLVVTERISERVEVVKEATTGREYRAELLNGKAYLQPRIKTHKGTDNPRQRDALNPDKADYGTLPEDQLPLL